MELLSRRVSRVFDRAHSSSHEDIPIITIEPTESTTAVDHDDDDDDDEVVLHPARPVLRWMGVLWSAYSDADDDDDSRRSLLTKPQLLAPTSPRLIYLTLLVRIPALMLDAS